MMQRDAVSENTILKEVCNYCCDQMKRSIEEGKVMIGYDSAFRSYFIPLSWPHKSTQGLNYCPWCGTKLPKELDDEWHETLEKEYGITNPHRPVYPYEFDCDEWWKKRGL